MADEDDSGLFSRLSDKLGRGTDDAPEPSSEAGSEAVSDPDPEVPLPDLQISREPFQVKLPHNAEDLSRQGPGLNLPPAEDLATASKGRNQVDKILQNVERLELSYDGGGDSLTDAIEREREELNSTLEDLSDEYDSQQTEEDQLESWTTRLERVITYFELLHKNLEQNLENNDIENLSISGRNEGDYGDHADIIFGGAYYGVTYNNFETSQDIKEYNVDGYTGSTPSMNKYGMANAAGDLQFIYDTKLKPFVESDKRGLEELYKELSNLDSIIRENQELLTRMIQIRVNLERADRELNLEESIAEKTKNDLGEMNQHGKQMIQHLESDEDKEHELKVELEELMRQEEWIIEHFGEARDLIDNILQVDDYTMEEEEYVVNRIEESSNGRVNMSALVRELHESCNAEGPSDYGNWAANFYGEVRFESEDSKGIIGKVVYGVRELRRIDREEFVDLYNLRQEISELLNEYRHAGKTEQQVEKHLADEFDSEKQIQEEKNRLVSEAVQNVNMHLEESFESDNPVEEIEDKKGELKDAHKTLEELYSAKYRDISKLNTLYEDIITVEDTLIAIQDAVDDGATLETKTKLSSDTIEERTIVDEYKGIETDKPRKVGEILTQAFNKLSSLPDELDEAFMGEDKEAESYIEAYKELRDVKSEFNEMKKVVDAKKEFENELENLPQDQAEDAEKQFHLELELIGEDQLEQMVERLARGEAADALKETQELLNQISNEEKEELEILNEISGEEEELNQHIKQISRASDISDHYDLDRVISELKNMREYSVEFTKEIEQEIDRTKP
jgi:hypothetical protein